MVHDPITDEIRAIRHALAARFDNDISRIGDDIRRQQLTSDQRYVRLPKRQPRVLSTTNKPMHGSGEADVNQLENQLSPPRDR